MASDPAVLPGMCDIRDEQIAVTMCCAIAWAGGSEGAVIQQSCISHGPLAHPIWAIQWKQMNKPAKQGHAYASA